MLTLEDLKRVLAYDPETGIFRWRVRKGPRAQAGAIAGSFPEGYRVIRVDGRNYRAARVAWLFVHGKWPRHLVDHCNKNTSDDRIANLREATNAENQRNRKGYSASGVKGVYWHKQRQKWTATINVDGKRKNIGLYDSLLAAEVARGQVAAIFHGKFASY